MSLKYEVTEIFDDRFRLQSSDLVLDVTLLGHDGLLIAVNRPGKRVRQVPMSPIQAKTLREWLAKRF